MKNKRGLSAVVWVLYFPAILLSGCMKDKVTQTYKIFTPILETLTKFRQQIGSQPAHNIATTGKMTLYGSYIFVSEPFKGIHVIDNSNPAAPTNVSFINIPGNANLAIRGNMLYADSYGDLVTLDITDPRQVVVKDFETYVFPGQVAYSNTMNANGPYNPDSINVIIGYTSRDTTADYDPGIVYFSSGNCPNCSMSGVPTANAIVPNQSTSTGVNGSLTRFSIIGDYLYTIKSYSLSAFNLSGQTKPVMTSSFAVNYLEETIFPFKDKLFVGTVDGMYMYDVQSSPSNPVFVGKFTHIRSCDPAIADENYAYVTLNDSSSCLGFNNQLQIVDIRDMSNAFMVQVYQLVHPEGLSKDGNILFVCDSRDGLKVYDAVDPANLRLLEQLKDGIVYDVVAAKGHAIVIAADGIYQYDYTDLNQIRLVSKL